MKMLFCFHEVPSKDARRKTKPNKAVMNKLILSTLAAGALLASGGAASAIQYVDDNQANVWINILNPSYTGSWDIAGEGYNPLSQQITSATATFALNDAFGGRESYTITIDGDTFLTGGSFSTPLFGSITLGDSISGTAFITLDTTGHLSYTVYRGSGEFWLVDATLTADTAPRNNDPSGSVPDGGMTLVMLGCGLLGLAGIRKFASR
jgi:VPDSG-CTERM motif